MIGTPSSLGNGTVKAIPTFVPTHRSPLLAMRDVTWIDLCGWLTSRAAKTLETFDAILMSWRWRNVSVWYKHMVDEFLNEIQRPTPDCAIWWTCVASLVLRSLVLSDVELNGVLDLSLYHKKCIRLIVTEMGNIKHSVATPKNYFMLRFMQI